MQLIQVLLALSATPLLFIPSESLECGWQTGSGKLVPYIQGKITNNTTNSLEKCQQLCVDQSEYLCHSVNYVSDQCELLMENLQTASINQTASSWMYSIRPACAGMWLPWSAEQGLEITGSDILSSTSYTNNRVKQCTTFCMTEYVPSEDCRSVKLKRTGEAPSCELQSKRLGDSGVSVKRLSFHQTFNRPSWYLDDSQSATRQTLNILDNDGGTAIHILNVTHRLPASGYLVGWRYRTRQNITRACESYADIWRPTGGNNFRLISKTRLNQPPTTGLKFQFVQDVVRVQKNDVVGFHVQFDGTVGSAGGLPVGCGGNLVTFNARGAAAKQPVRASDIEPKLTAYERKMNEGVSLNFKGSLWKVAAINVFVAEYLTVEQPVIQCTDGGVTTITWSKPTEEPLPLLYRLQCSTDADFTTVFSCTDNLIEETEYDLTLKSKQIIYVRVQVLRNINGQSYEDLTFGQAKGFCTAHSREVKLEITRVNETSNTVGLTVAITGLEADDDCADQYQIQLTNTATNEVSNTDFISVNQNSSLTLTRGDQYYNIQLNLQLRTGHVMMNVVSEIVRYDAPPGTTTSPDVTTVGMRNMSGAIVGSVIGVIVLIVIVILLIVYIKRRKPTPGYKSPVGDDSQNKPSTSQNMFYENCGRSDSNKNMETSVHYESVDPPADPEATTVLVSSKTSPSPTPTNKPKPEQKKLSEVGQRQSRHDAGDSKPELKPRPTLSNRDLSDPIEKNEPSEELLYENVHTIPVIHLASYIHNEVKKNPESPFKNEFLRLKQTKEDPKSEGRKEHNKAKNRFKNIVAYDDNRVMLPLDSVYKSDYINASFIPDEIGNDRRFIACQGPKPETVVDMWRMIISQSSKVIVMITNLVETGKVKCAQYWPESKQVDHSYDEHITVRQMQEFVYAEYVQRTLSYTYNTDSEQKEGVVELFHYTQWYDHDVPSTAGLLSFRQKVRAEMNNTSSPVIVHCSAGAGRTGTFIGLDNLVSRSESPTGSKTEIDVFSTAQSLRELRPSMIQTSDQYWFLYRVVADEVDTGKTWLYTSDFAETYQQWKDESQGNSKLAQQFDRLTSSKSLTRPLKFTAGQLPENQSRNRTDILAGDLSRAFLADGDNNYINAVFVNGYYRERAYICTQNPLPNTTKHFWSLISERNCSVVLYFHQHGEEKPFPIEEDGLTVSLTKSVEVSDTITKYTSSLDIEQSKRTVEIFELPLGDRLPTHQQLSVLCHSLERHAETKNQTIAVVCSDGSRISGLFVTAMNLFLRLKIEQQLDVVLEVKLARRSRPEFIPTLKELELLYEFVNMYLSSFETYSNFAI